MEVKIHENLHLNSSKLQSFLKNMILIMFFVPFVPYTNSTSLETTNFSFTSFDPNMHNIVFEGDASTTNQVIQLTINQRDKSLNGSTGRVTYKEPVHLWDKVSGNLADFTTHFSFVIDSQNKTPYADGFAFFLASNGSRLPDQSGGGNLGLQNRDKNFNYDNYSFVAVEFDTFSNYLDPKNVNDHVGIDLDNVISVEFVEWWWSKIVNGGKAEAWVSYNSSSKNLSVLLVDGNDLSYRNSSSLYLIVDLKKFLPEWVSVGFSGSTGSYFEIHKIYSWDFNSSLRVAEDIISKNNNTPVACPLVDPRSRKKGFWVVLAIASIGLNGVLVGLVWFFCWMKWSKSNQEVNTAGNNGDEMELVPAGPRKFSYEQLVIATNNFAEEGFLGKGGFGRVYSGFLKDINSIVAVKRINPESTQGLKEFTSELNTISRLRHRNLVQLIGWCYEKREFIIVYEFMPNKSLDFHLFSQKCLLTWEKRYTMALSLASALFYLQEECEQCVLHRDIKSSNVLLDLNFDIKLGDFGLARLVDHGKESQTTVLFGTQGYIAPEYLESSRATRESDVYSFGIVALEIASGKKAIDEFVRNNGEKCRMKLVDWVWEHYGSGDIHAAADPRLCQNYVIEQMEHLIVVGLACAHPNRYDRPSVRQVVEMLNFKAPVPVLPSSQPTYVKASVSSFHETTQSSSSSSNTGSSKASAIPSIASR